MTQTSTARIDGLTANTLTVLADIRARKDAARLAAITTLTTHRSATLGRNVTIPEE
jgi:hypothetical protein